VTEGGRREGLKARLERTREALSRLPPDEVARRGGGSLLQDCLELPFFGERYLLTWPGLQVLGPDGKECSEELTTLLLDYLSLGDGSPPSGRWIGFRELPHGGFYFRAFQGYTGDALVRALDLRTFRDAAASLGGVPLPLGDAAYAFSVLPKLPLAVVWWEGGEEFSPKAMVLFDAVAGRYLPTEGLAILGRLLCRRLIKAAGRD